MNKGDRVSFRYDVHKVGTVYTGKITAMNESLVHISTELGKYIINKDDVVSETGE